MGTRVMIERKLLDITNHFQSPLRVDLEPVPQSYILEPTASLEIIELEEGSSVGLRVGQLDNGQPYVAVWPDRGRVRLARDGGAIFSDE